MEARLNRILDQEQISQILEVLLIDRPLKILKVIARSGKQQTSVPWIYYENEITKNRFASFVSFKDLTINFWRWLATVQLLAIAILKRQAISKAVWHYVQVGDWIYSSNYGWAKVINKELTNVLKLPRLWLQLESDSKIEIEEPCFVEMF